MLQHTSGYFHDEVREQAYDSLAYLSSIHRKGYLSPCALVKRLCPPSRLHRGCDSTERMLFVLHHNSSLYDSLCLNNIPLGG